MSINTDTSIDITMSIDVDMPEPAHEWPKRQGLIKVKRDPDDMLPTPVSPRDHIANEPDQPEWPQFRFATSDIVGLVVASVLALPPIALLGWIIFGGLS